MISKHEFNKAFENCGFDPAPHKYDGFCNACDFGNVRSKKEAAQFLANLFHESNGLRVKEEQHFSPSDYRHNGISYHGRGYIQLTHHYNYKAASRDIYGDDRLLRNPDLVLHGDLPFTTAGWFWRENVHPKYDGSFESSINCINSIDRQDQRQRRRRFYSGIKRAFNI